MGDAQTEALKAEGVDSCTAGSVTGVVDEAGKSENDEDDVEVAELWEAGPTGKHSDLVDVPQ